MLPESPMERRRLAAGLSRRDLAAATGISARQIVRYENEGVSPPYEKALAIAGTLGCTTEELFSEDDLPAPTGR